MKLDIGDNMPVFEKHTRMGIYLGIFFASFYWLLETVVHVYLFGEGTFLSEFFPTYYHELYMRTLTASLFLLMGSTIYIYNVRVNKYRKEVRQLSGLLPICSTCKKIKDEEGAWQQMESYIDSHSDAKFSHSYCPVCMEEARLEMRQSLKSRKKQSQAV
jgi:hypothetical protein